MTRIALFALLLGVLASCGGPSMIDRRSPNNPNIPQQVDQDAVVVIAVASFEVNVNPAELYATSKVVNITLSPNTQFSIDTTAFVVPTPANELLSFGNLTVNVAFTNQLKLCGTGGHQKCTKALLQMYTSGVAGAGFWNTVDGYGAPMTAGLAGELQTINLSQASAVTLESWTIPSNRNTLRLSDFTPAPVFLVSGDFTDAGEGAYSTTINVALALSL